MMNRFTVYILFSERTNRFYIGQTQNLEKRLLSHNSGYNRSTKAGIPWIIFAYIHLTSRSEAMITERKIKNLKSRNRIIEYAPTASAAPGSR